MLDNLPHGQEVDWWALGVIMYAMLTGDYPFDGTDTKGLCQEIKCQEVEYPKEISRDAVLFIRRVSIINIKTEALHVLE
jgi:serine/threonine protein kinase